MNHITNIHSRKPLNRKNVSFLFHSIFSYLEDDSFLSNYILHSFAFIRNRKLPLSSVVKLLFARVLTSTSLFLALHSPSVSISKQAFSKARKNICPSLFQDLNRILIQDRYDHYHLKTYHHKYLLFSIDGSSLEIPNTSHLRKTLGHTKGQPGAKEMARASISCIYDSINSICITSTIEKYSTSEREIAVKLIKEVEEMETFQNKDILYLMDRGYFSRDLLKFLLSTNRKFLFRLKKQDMKQYFDSLEGMEGFRKVKDALGCSLRFTKVILDTGEEEHLLSNIEDVDYEEMKGLYFYRWRIEENYRFLKGRLQIENFSGKSENSIKQEFYSTILTANLLSLIQQTVKSKKTRKHYYKANRNLLVGFYKNFVASKILEPFYKIMKGFRKVFRLLSYYLIQESPKERKVTRVQKPKVRANLYFLNMRPN